MNAKQLLQTIDAAAADAQDTTDQAIVDARVGLIRRLIKSFKQEEAIEAEALSDKDVGAILFALSRRNDERGAWLLACVCSLVTGAYFGMVVLGK